MTDVEKESAPVGAINDVTLAGRISRDPEVKTLPSGDTVVTFRVVVPRPEARAGSRRGGGVDTLDCAVWSGRAKRTATALQAGQQAVVTGALRRRFFRAGAATASRVEVEVASVRVLRQQPAVTRRAASA